MLKHEFSAPDTHNFIYIKGAKVHNLKDIDVVIPKNKLVVITGLSGSGKSSLAFDTLYADGQRRYVESLSSYARQFLGRMSKPEVDYIKGIAPAIAIEQRVNTRNPRSTVGTSTEIYEYLKLLFARIGITYSPISGKQVKRQTVTDVVDYVLSLKKGSSALIYAPLQFKEGRSVKEELSILLQQGFSRIRVRDEIIRIEQALEKVPKVRKIFVVVDRIILNEKDQDTRSRIADSVEIAFFEGNGVCLVESEKEGKKIIEKFSNKFEADGITFEEPSVNLFSFNNPYGACRLCEGFGSIIGIDENLVIPNRNLSVF